MLVTASDLPFELVQEILIISAKSGLKQAAKLATVSHHVHSLIKPILLRTLVYWDDGYAWPGYLNAEWLESNGKYARNLLWAHNDASMDLILKYCTNLTNIAIWLDSTENENKLRELVVPLYHLRPRRFSADFIDMFGGRFLERHAELPMFSNLTHLEFAGGCSSWEHIEGIQFLPKLTHLSVPAEGDDLPPIITNSLHHCKGLAVFLMFSSGTAPRVAGSEKEEVAFEVPLKPEIESIGDPRVVSFNCAYVEEWEVGSQGGRDMWTLAEEIIEGRLRNLRDRRFC